MGSYDGQTHGSYAAIAHGRRNGCERPIRTDAKQPADVGMNVHCDRIGKHRGRVRLGRSGRKAQQR